MDGPARPASARPHRQGWPSPTRIGLRLACSKALERFLALMGRHLARASEANAALLGSLAALAGPGGPRAENAANFFRSSARGLPRTSAIRRFVSSPLSACAGALSGFLSEEGRHLLLLYPRLFLCICHYRSHDSSRHEQGLE